MRLERGACQDEWQPGSSARFRDRTPRAHTTLVLDELHDPAKAYRMFRRRHLAQTSELGSFEGEQASEQPLLPDYEIPFYVYNK